MYGFSSYGNAAYGSLPTSSPVYLTSQDLVSQVSVAAATFADLLSRISVGTSTFNDIPSAVAVGLTGFFVDLPSQVSLPVSGFQDLVGQTTILGQASIDLPSQVPIAASTFTDLNSQLAIGATGLQDLSSQSSVAAQGFADITDSVAVATQTSQDFSSSVVISQLYFTDLTSSVRVLPLLFQDLPSQAAIAAQLPVDYNSQTTISNYKWLSPTLYNAQQQPNVRFAFKTFITDDSVGWNSNIGTQPFPIWGDAVMAPDGSLLVVGTYNNNGTVDGNLYFKKITNPSNPSSWTITGATQLLTSSQWNYKDANGQYPLPPSIAVSDWINGTYTIDVYYWCPGNTGYYQISQLRSVDGGNTWNTYIVNSQAIPTTASGLYMGLSAGQPVNNGTSTNATVFWLAGGSGTSAPGSTSDRIRFAYSPNGNYTSITASTQWNANYVDSNDWTLSGLSVYYHNNFYYVVFSGYHNQYESNNKNFGLYLTRVNAPNGDLSFNTGLGAWMKPKNILVSNSTTAVNQANFTLPKLSFDGNKLYLTFKGRIVQSIDENQNVTTAENYYLCESQNFLDFSYPLLLTDTNNNIFADPNATLGISTTFQSRYGFIPFSSNFNNTFGYPAITNFYLMGNGGLWQYVQNNTTADVSDYVLSYDISETAGGPSSINLTIGNANGQWVGVSPTLPNYQAIKKNAKIYLLQGYYNANGVPEYAPKNIFYIDDIQQKVTATKNDLVITGRDFYKQFKTTISKFAYNYQGTDFIVDNFNGATLSNWSAVGGINWNEGPNPQVNSGGSSYPYTIYPSSPALTSAVTNGVSSLVSLSGLNITQSDWLLAVCVQVPTTGFSEIYFVYIDQNNWIKLALQAQNPYWQVILNYNGSITVLAKYSNGPSLGGYMWYPVWVRGYYYNTYDIYIGSALTTPSEYGQYLEIYKITSSAGVGTLASGSSLVQTIALGNTNGAQAAFAKLFLAQYRQDNSIQRLVEDISAKAGIYNFWRRYIYQEYFDDMSKWTITNGNSNNIQVLNNRLVLNGGYNQTLSSIFYNYQQFSDAEIEFDAQSQQNDPTYNYYLEFFFRSQDGTNNTAYRCEISASANKNLSVAIVSPQATTLARSNLNGTSFDITQPHHYRIGFSGSLMYVFIDEVMVVAWRDDNNTYAKGYIGFYSYPNGNVYIWNIRSRQFFDQINQFIINPGDDVENAITSVAEIKRGWIASNLMGQVDLLALSQSDPVTYYYGDNAQNFLLIDQEVDNSDKEYVNRVTVIGNGVAATAQNNASIGTSGILREQVVVDYQITTLKDAQDRANYELQNFNKFNTQPAPKLNNNVGSEIFDVVNVKDTSNPNASNYNSNARVYNQETVLNGQTGEYTLTLGLGQV